MSGLKEEYIKNMSELSACLKKLYTVFGRIIFADVNIRI